MPVALVCRSCSSLWNNTSASIGNSYFFLRPWITEPYSLLDLQKKKPQTTKALFFPHALQDILAPCPNRHVEGLQEGYQVTAHCTGDAAHHVMLKMRQIKSTQGNKDQRITPKYCVSKENISILLNTLGDIWATSALIKHARTVRSEKILNRWDWNTMQL